MGRDGSDWDYINEHLGGHDEDGLPNFMSEPGFSEKEHQVDREPSHFDTFQEAKIWAKNNPGRSIVRSSDGKKFTTKHKEKSQFVIERDQKSFDQIGPFIKLIAYRRVGNLDTKRLRLVLTQLSLSELMSLIPLLRVELKSCHNAIKMCARFKRNGRNESLQALDLEEMIKEVAAQVLNLKGKKD